MDKTYTGLDIEILRFIYKCQQKMLLYSPNDGMFIDPDMSQGANKLNLLFDKNFALYYSIMARLQKEK